MYFSDFNQPPCTRQFVLAAFSSITFTLVSSGPRLGVTALLESTGTVSLRVAVPTPRGTTGGSERPAEIALFAKEGRLLNNLHHC